MSRRGSMSYACSAARRPAPPLPRIRTSHVSSVQSRFIAEPQLSVDVRKARSGALRDVVVHALAVRVHRDDQRAERPDAELPEALRHQIFPVDAFDRLDLFGF